MNSQVLSEAVARRPEAEDATTDDDSEKKVVVFARNQNNQNYLPPGNEIFRKLLKDFVHDNPPSLLSMKLVRKFITKELGITQCGKGFSGNPNWEFLTCEGDSDAPMRVITDFNELLEKIRNSTRPHMASAFGKQKRENNDQGDAQTEFGTIQITPEPWWSTAEVELPPEFQSTEDNRSSGDTTDLDSNRTMSVAEAFGSLLELYPTEAQASSSIQLYDNTIDVLKRVTQVKDLTSLCGPGGPVMKSLEKLTAYFPSTQVLELACQNWAVAFRKRDRDAVDMSNYMETILLLVSTVKEMVEAGTTANQVHRCITPLCFSSMLEFVCAMQRAKCLYASQSCWFDKDKSFCSDCSFSIHNDLVYFAFNEEYGLGDKVKNILKPRQCGWCVGQKALSTN